MSKDQGKDQEQEETRMCGFTREPCMGKDCVHWVTTQMQTNLGVGKPVGMCVFVASFLKPPIIMMNSPSQLGKMPMMGVPK